MQPELYDIQDKAPVVYPPETPGPMITAAGKVSVTDLELDMFERSIASMPTHLRNRLFRAFSTTDVIVGMIKRRMR